MNRLLARSAAMLLILGLLSAPAAAAFIPPPGSPRLTGHFQLDGRVTVAKHILGEHPGDVVSRLWTFVPLCPAGPCPAVELVRQRAAGSDTVLIRATSPTSYSGAGRFYAPLRCGRRIHRKGESVRFTITVTVTATAIVFGVPIASRIHATYRNRARTNLTRCVAVRGRDAAVYDGPITG